MNTDRTTADMEHQPPEAGKRYSMLIKWPRCPACASIRLKAYRTVRHGGEQVTRYSRCKMCGAKILITVQ
jgi:DNA-directed RNA polymerase subunit RPC12/RpoP